jgi:predicted dehydrogenase
MAIEQKMQLGVIGCGDFLRCMARDFKESKRVAIKALYDPAKERAGKHAEDLGGQVAASADAIFADPAIETVCLFVPPWLRTDLWVKAAQAGKHVLATKPIASNAADCGRILASGAKSRGGVIYGRTGDGWSVAMKRVLDSGEIGKLALYRHDWVHHYPQWNTWALDPSKNGGPFMDAMIHNLQQARFLMGRPMTTATFFSEKLAHPTLTCADTESLKAGFADNGSALIFITWAADLAVPSTEGNYREHFDIFYLVTDQGWRVTREQNTIVASRAGEKKTWPAADLGGTICDRFAAAVRSGAPFPEDIVSVEMAAGDIRLLRTLEKQPGVCVNVEL